MKNLWKSKAFGLSFRIFKWSLAVYIVVVAVRSYYTYTLENGEVLTENITNYKENYYFTFGHVKEADAIKLDENLVYYVDYSKIKSLGVSNQLVYSPVTLSLNALRSHQRWQREYDNREYDIFLANADWLVENINDDGEWPLTQDVTVGQYTVEAPWCSALSQGLAMSVLCRAFEHSGDHKYIQTARKALAPFKKDIAEGGVRTTNDFGVFYEEYPLPENPTHVLNGCAYSLFGLYDLFLYDNNIEALGLFTEGVNGLAGALGRYDSGNWTYYSLNKESNLRNHWNYCSPWYQKLHTNQVTALYNITGNATFKHYADTFAEQRDGSFVNWIIYPAYTAYTDFVWVKRKFG